jgi:hypothetical protein
LQEFGDIRKVRTIWQYLGSYDQGEMRGVL